MSKMRAFLLSTVAIAALLVAVADRASAGPPEDVKAKVDKLTDLKGAEFWQAVAELEDLGPDAVGALAEALKRPEPKAWATPETKASAATIAKLTVPVRTVVAKMKAVAMRIV